MKRKHKDAMIAMGLKIAGHENLLHDQYVKISDANQEIANIQRTLRLHGEAHMANDLTPQFTELCKKVGELDNVVDMHLQRLADHDESIEALSETVDQNTLSAKMFLERVTDIEILKTQMAGVEKTIYNSPFSKIVMEQYAATLKTLVRDVDTLKIQMHNLIPVHNNMMAEVLKQKAFLEKVQKILDRERDARIKKTPGYKKEISAQKKEAMVMDKHVDMMVKKGMPRKP